MSVNYVSFSRKEALLCSDFGKDLALKWFNLTSEDLEAKVGVYKRGKNKGKLKGIIFWYKVERGGWVKLGQKIEYANGFVCKHKICFAKGIYLRGYFEPNKYVLGYCETIGNLEADLAQEYKIYLNKKPPILL